MPYKFIARENIKRYRMALETTPDEERKATIGKLLEQEERHLRDLLCGKE